MKNENRDHFCRGTSILRCLLALLVLFGTVELFAQVPITSGTPAKGKGNEARYKVGVCDWMILKRQKLGAFRWASELKSDGVEVDMGSLGNRLHFESVLCNAADREQFLAEAAKYNVEISSIAMSGFYAQNFAERPDYESLTQEAIDAASQMGVKNIFLPLGVCNPKVHPEYRKTLVERLKVVGDNAAKAGVVIAVETALPASEDLKLLKEIGSKGIKLSVNFSRILENDRDIVSELKTLKSKNIAQIHVTNTDGVWLENDPQIDMPAVKQALDKMKWQGWLLIERSRDVKRVHDVRANYTANAVYLKSVFNN